MGCTAPRFRLTGQRGADTWPCLSSQYPLTETHSARTEPTLLVSVSSSRDQRAHSRESNAGHGCDRASCPHHPAKHSDSRDCSAGTEPRARSAPARADTRVLQTLTCRPCTKDKMQKNSVILLLNVHTMVPIQSRTRRAAVFETPGPAGWCFYFRWTA